MARVKSFRLKASTTSLREGLRRLAGTGGPPWRTAASFGLGVAVGLLPIMPFQSGTAVALAFLLRLNRLAVLIGTLVWQPFTAPFILAAEYAIGRLLLAPLAPGQGTALERWAWPLVPGGAVVALLGGALSGAALYAALARRARQKGASSVHQDEGQE
jgi:uncharacterized protein (DUF2062 family)